VGNVLCERDEPATCRRIDDGFTVSLIKAGSFDCARAGWLGKKNGSPRFASLRMTGLLITGRPWHVGLIVVETGGLFFELLDSFYENSSNEHAGHGDAEYGGPEPAPVVSQRRGEPHRLGIAAALQSVKLVKGDEAQHGKGDEGDVEKSSIIGDLLFRAGIDRGQEGARVGRGVAGIPVVAIGEHHEQSGEPEDEIKSELIHRNP